MTDERRAALAEARELLAACRGHLERGNDPALTLLARAVEALADAIEAEPTDGRPTNARVVDEGGPPGGQQFDRSRPHRGYNRNT